MRVLVLLEVGADTRIPPERDPRSGRVRDEWLVREIDPGSASALELALHMKTSRPDVDVTVVHLGPSGAEFWLRLALAYGADRAVRIWDPEAAGAHAAGKAVVLAAAAQAAGFDLVLAGAAGVLDACGQLGVLLAERLGVPCVTQAVDIIAPDGADAVEITRGLDRGYRQRVEAALPAVATVAAAPAESASRSPSAAALLAAQTSHIPMWDLADLGVPSDRVRCADATLRYGPPRSLRPKLQHLAAPDSSLPAFERILRLIEGSVQRREGRVVRDSAAAVADEVFRTLRDEGWLDHLRNSGSACTGTVTPDTPDVAGHP